MTGAQRSMRVGFIGLGDQGGAIARRIIDAGFPTTVWARREEAVIPFVEAGANKASSIAALGAAVDLAGICVLDDAGVASICESLIPAMRAGSILAVHSTISPQHCEELAARCAIAGIGFLDAPVSGGRVAAEAGTLTVMCGGSEETLTGARPVFDSFAALVVLLGESGSGQRAKIVNNALLAANLGMAHAAIGIGEGLGIDRAALARLIGQSSGRSYAMEVYGRLPAPGAFARGGPLLEKDIGLLRDMAEGSADAEALYRAAEPFLTAALGRPLSKD